MIYQEYNPETGEILCTRTMSEETADYMRRELNICLIEGEGDNSTHYVDITQTPPKIVPRTPQSTAQSTSQIAADGNDTLILSDLPLPCSVRIGESTYDVDDGVLEWSTVLAGRYPITVSSFPHVDWKGEVIAT